MTQSRWLALLILTVGPWGCAAPRPIESTRNSTAAAAPQHENGAATLAETQQFMVPKDVSMLVQKEIPALRRCYQEHMDASRPQERIKLRWTVERSGKTSNVRVEETTFQDRLVEQCLVERILSWVLPPPAEPTDVVYPFVFRPR
jgi:hypothetical protein